MSSREKILNAIGANKPALAIMPEINIAQVTVYDDVVAKFRETLQSIGGEVHDLVNIEELEKEIQEHKDNGRFIINMVTPAEADRTFLEQENAAHILQTLDTVYIKASLGVAENGAVWISGSSMGNRLLPFICQHLVILLEMKTILSTMHHAYAAINAFEEGFGAFIAGPSKTADIEQSLVIGAHGARSLRVYLIQDASGWIGS